MMATEMPAAISPYSMAVAPRSSVANSAACDANRVQSRAISIIVVLCLFEGIEPLQKRRQMRDQRHVGRWHRIVAQLVRHHPLEPLAFERCDRPLPAPTYVERHQKVKVLVGVARKGERRKARLPDDDSEFLLELANQC